MTQITDTQRQIAINYKKNISNNFMLVDGAKLRSRICGDEFYVTRKIDGHLQCLFYEDGEAFLLNSQGKERATDLSCIDVCIEQLKAAGIKSAVIVGELYMPNDIGRPRCNDVISALADSDKKDSLYLAPFDILSLDEEVYNTYDYAFRHQKLCSIFIDKMTLPVEMLHVNSSDMVQKIYDEWVVEQGAEGLVVRSGSQLIWKVKPRHTIDAAIIGYTKGDIGVRGLMMAARREDGAFQMFAVGSSGISDEDRVMLEERLSSMHVESEYVLSDSRGIAYQMVHPEIVYELSVIEFVARGSDDKIRTNPLLRFDNKRGWLMDGAVAGVSVLGLSFERERVDKQPSCSDIRLSQITDLCPFETLKPKCTNLATSTLLERLVYRKVQGDKVMLHKFLLWRTNKESSGRFPAYILYHTDYSSKRKEMLKRDMLYSNSESQIRELLQSELADNIKKGWVQVELPLLQVA